MTIEAMHYELKTEVNRLDSNVYRQLRIPEIDWKLNQAQAILINSIANPRQPVSGFELNQRSRSDLSPIAVDALTIQAQPLSSTQYTVEKPENYLYFTRAYANCVKQGCERKIRVWVVQQDDLHEEYPFSKSSFEWEEVNGYSYEGGLKAYTDGSFSIRNIELSYLRQPKYMHLGSYQLPDGTPLTGNQDCELGESLHRSIVSLAALIITGNLQIGDYDIKLANFKLTNNE